MKTSIPDDLAGSLMVAVNDSKNAVGAIDESLLLEKLCIYLSHRDNQIRAYAYARGRLEATQEANRELDRISKRLAQLVM